MSDLSGCVAIITGAVGNLGLATARAFEARGASLVLVDRSPTRLAEVFPAAAGSDHHLLQPGTDLTDASSVGQVVENAQERFGRIDVLVNTVGGFHGGPPTHEDDPRNWEKMFTLNVIPTLLISRAVAASMLAQDRSSASGGRIVNVASQSALAGAKGLGAYSAAKSAVLRLTETMACELGKSGIGVNAVMPGTLDTPQNRAAMPNADQSKWVAPEAVADVIAFLCSPAARAVTGAAIPIAGVA